MMNSFLVAAIFLAYVVLTSVVSASPHCKKNEELSTCFNNVCNYKNCSEVGQPIKCEISNSKHCKKDCLCIKNYLRADNGTCILANQCPNALKCSKANEYYDLCPPKCPSRTCNVVDNGTCPELLQVGNPNCSVPACRCSESFYRDTTGNCVLWSLCNATSSNTTTSNTSSTSTSGSTSSNVTESTTVSSSTESTASTSVSPASSTTQSTTISSTTTPATESTSTMVSSSTASAASTTVTSTTKVTESTTLSPTTTTTKATTQAASFGNEVEHLKEAASEIASDVKSLFKKVSDIIKKS